MRHPDPPCITPLQNRCGHGSPCGISADSAFLPTRVHHSAAKQMRERISAFVEAQEHVTSFHALYIDPNTRDIYVDLVVDYELKDWDALRADFTAFMAQRYPESRLELVIETMYV